MPRRLLLPALAILGFCVTPALGQSTGRTTIADQPSWNIFQQALDGYEFERAAKMAQGMPPGPARNLALAEVAALSERVDQSYRATDALEPGSLPNELKAKYFLIRAYQQEAEPNSSYDKTRESVLRLIAEGMRQPGSAHDYGRLSLLRLESLGWNDDNAAKKTLTEMSKIPGLDSSFLVEAEARIAFRDDRFAQAAALWRTLAENATLRGRTRAGLIFSLEALRARLELGFTPRDSADLRSALRVALSSNDAFALRQYWKALYYRIPIADRSYLVEVTEAVVKRAVTLQDKLSLMDRLGSQGDEASREFWMQRAYELARTGGDRVLELHFLNEVADGLLYGRDQVSKAEGERLRGRATALAQELDTRGVSMTWYRQARAPRPARAEPEWTLSGLEESLARPEPREAQRERNYVLTRYLMHAMESGDAALAERSFTVAWEEARELPPTAQSSALNFLLNALSVGTWPYDETSLFNLEGSLGEAQMRALSELAQRRPELVANLVDETLASAQDASRLSPFYARQTASWLAFLDRREEAYEVMRMEIAAETDPREKGRLMFDLGGMRARAGDRAGLTMMRQGLAVSGEERDPRRLTNVGWEALRLGDLGDAEKLALEALALLSGRSESLLGAETYQLHALALSRMGRYEEALAAVESGETAARSSTPPSRLSLAGVVRADILQAAGRREDAARALAETPMKGVVETGSYELRVRREVARASGDTAGARAIEDQVRAYLAAPTSLPGNPLFASIMGDALGQPSELELPRRPRVKSTLADIGQALERLRQREPENESLRAVSVADLKRLSRAAAADEVYVGPILLKRSLALIMVTRNDVSLVEIICDRERLEKAERILTSSFSSPGGRPDIYRTEQTYLEDRLVAPWRERYPSASRLRWMAGSALGKVPVSALRGRDGEPLRESMAITYLDGPAVNDVTLGPESETVLVGGASDLGGSEEELRMVRGLFPEGSRWHLGSSLQTLQDLVSSSSLVHISTHGSVPSPASPSGYLSGDGGTVSAFQLSELAFPLSCLAVVATCDSYIDAGTGRDNTSLVSALRTAGADVVVGSLWELDDKVTTELFKVFYERLREGRTPDIALAAAQNAVARRWPDPYYWAGLQVVSGP